MPFPFPDPNGVDDILDRISGFAQPYLFFDKLLKFCSVCLFYEVPILVDLTFCEVVSVCIDLEGFKGVEVNVEAYILFPGTLVDKVSSVL